MPDHEISSARIGKWDKLDLVLPIGLTLFLVLLPFHLVIKKLIPDPLGTYWKEALLILLVLFWFLRSVLTHRPLLTKTRLDWAVLFYAGYLVLRFLLDRSGWVGGWGLYISIMYLPLFWLVPAALRDSPAWLERFLLLMVSVGMVAAAGGVIEFLLDRALWPSAETIQRQGFPDVFIYGTHLRRVYFVFDSPTTLANTLALLLPLAFALLLTTRRNWIRLVSGLAIALMTGCIVVTFSRGIWIASVLALVMMSLQSSFIQRNRRVLFAGLVGVVIILVVWGIYISSRSIVVENTTVVELTRDDYIGAHITSVAQDLLHSRADTGDVENQDWALSDTLAGQDDVRTVIYEHPGENGKSEIIYRVSIPQSGALRFAIALSPEVWSPDKGDGVNFQVYVSESGDSNGGKFVFDRYINPKINPNDRRWRNYIVDLSQWAGQTINLSFIVESGPAGDFTYDWAGWSDPQIVTISPEFFSGNVPQRQNVVIQQIRSILDWTRDQTNRDRLVAWSMALNAWKKSPLWGIGLGTTGVAAFRTHPETAFVTESQVLKALTELGVLGLLTLLYLWFEIARIGFITYRKMNPSVEKVILFGILVSLSVVIVEGWVYQNLEVKQVNGYFWTLVGMLAFLAGKHSD